MRYTCPTDGCEVRGYVTDDPGFCSICLADLVPTTEPTNLTIFGDEHVLAPVAPAPRPVVAVEQPRLFEPQIEGQLAFAGGEDNPEER